MVVGPWGTVPGEARAGEETATVDVGMADGARIRSELPLPRDRVLTIQAPRQR